MQTAQLTKQSTKVSVPGRALVGEIAEFDETMGYTRTQIHGMRRRRLVGLSGDR